MHDKKHERQTDDEDGPGRADKPPRELTPAEREELLKKIEEAKRRDSNIYPVF